MKEPASSRGFFQEAAPTMPATSQDNIFWCQISRGSKPGFVALFKIPNLSEDPISQPFNQETLATSQKAVGRSKLTRRGCFRLPHRSADGSILLRRASRARNASPILQRVPLQQPNRRNSGHRQPLYLIPDRAPCQHGKQIFAFLTARVFFFKLHMKNDGPITTPLIQHRGEVVAPAEKHPLPHSERP